MSAILLVQGDARHIPLKDKSVQTYLMHQEVCKGQYDGR